MTWKPLEELIDEILAKLSQQPDKTSHDDNLAVDIVQPTS
jgi:hypothetical protein